MEGDNVVIRSDGRRYCRACRNAAHRVWKKGHAVATAQKAADLKAQLTQAQGRIAELSAAIAGNWQRWLDTDTTYCFACDADGTPEKMEHKEGCVVPSVLEEQQPTTLTKEGGG